MAPIALIPQASDRDIAKWLHRRLQGALAREPGRINVTVPGGSTPFPILAELARLPIDWARIVVWPNDDRMVSEDHPASNTGRLRQLLEPVGAQVASLSEGARPPHFALTWLGMGADGHVASLFPSSDPRVDEPATVRRIVPEPLPPEAPFARLTLTIAGLLDTAEVLFVIRGAEKRAVFDGARAGETDTPVARLLSAATQPVTCFT